MKGISKIVFMGLLLSGFNCQAVYAAQDVVKTYHSDWVESIYFANGSGAIVTAKDGTTTGGTKQINIVPVPGSTFTLTLYDDGLGVDKLINDGIYTGQIPTISNNPMSLTNLQLVDTQKVNIVVDLDNLGDRGTATIIADYTNPIIPTPPGVTVSEEHFSPSPASPGKKDTTTISFKSNENGRYEILIDNRVPSGTPNGILLANATATYVWNGYDKDGSSFLEGVHTIQVKVYDEAGNGSSIYTCEVWIDKTFPVKVYMSLTDDCFSPGTSPANQDTTCINLRNDEDDPLNYKLSIGTRTLLGTGTPMGTGTGQIPNNGITTFEWGGRDNTGTLFDEGNYTIDLETEDLAGNTATVTAEVTIDNTPPTITSLINDSGGNPVYRDQDIRFVLQASDWIGSNSVTANGGLAICTFNGKSLNLVDCGNGIYVQSYKVTQADVGTFGYTAYFEDKAGNPATNTYQTFGTITLRGNEYSPASGARIVRLNVATPEKGTFSINSSNITTATSTLTIKTDKIKKEDKIKITDNSHTWIASAGIDGEVTVSNANLFFGFPVDDYKKLATSTITEGAWLKGIIKTDDELTINLTAVNILEDNLYLSTYTSTLARFEDSRIGLGEMVVAYDTSGDHIWLGTVGTSGRFEISNANLYFGNLAGDYKGLGEIKGIKACFANNGEAFADMGIIVQGITLYDNGAYTHKDVQAGDGVYSNSYTIKEKNDTNSYFYGYFKSAGRDAENNGLKSQEQIEIDATPPNITNFGAFPGIFRPGSENVTIKYTLVKKADVTIEIWDDFNCIRKLTPPTPNYGDNCSAMWDGKNECGGLVGDGDYFYKINAVDEAGNNAAERVGLINASTIDLKITNLNIIPSRFTPNPDIPGMVDFRVNFNVEMEATEAQLKNLNFAMDTNDISTLPYVLVDLTCFDVNGNKIRTSGPDLTSDYDSDPFTQGWPLYYTGPLGSSTYGWGSPKLGADLPDDGDGDKGNDWDTLVPLQRSASNPNQYYMDWGVGMIDWNFPNGTYIIRVQVKLIGSYWKFIDYKYDANRIPIAEMWHQKPNEGQGYGKNSGSVEGRIEVVYSPITKPDYIAPVVVATNPGLNTIHEPTENIKEVSAKLMDIGNAGVDLTLSEIILKNSVGMVIPGKFSNNGVDTVKWILDEPLTTPDDYTIEVKPIDKSKNGSSDAPQKFTFTILDREGPEIDDILVNGTALKNGDSFGPNMITKISVILSEIYTGKSKVDFPSSKIIIKNELTQEENEPHRLFGGSRREEKYTEDMSGVIIYENLSVEEGGTYTIWVEAYDGKGNYRQSPKITFYISAAGYINEGFNYPGLGTKTYLSIPPETIAYTNTTTGIVVSTNTIALRQGTITSANQNQNYTAIDPVIEFWWLNNEHIDIKLNPPANKVIPLTMYYGHITLPAGVTEDDLAIWRYNGTTWGKISGVNDIDKNNSKITVNLPLSPQISLENQYAIMYLTPKAVDVQYYHYQKGLVTCLKIPEATLVDGYVVGTNTVTAGTLTETREGYVVVEPVVQFFVKGAPVTNSSFTNPVTLIMYYTDEDVAKLTERGLKESDLAIYEYDGANWVKITNGVLDQNNKQITWTTKIIRGKYAIMYVIPGITETGVFKDSVRAYPNPAKGGKVTFRYDLSKEANISLKIYTIMGDLVWEKQYSSSSPQGKQGSHGVYPASPQNDIIWDLTNNAGKKVATELYIYKLTAADDSGEVTVTKKLIVVQ